MRWVTSTSEGFNSERKPKHGKGFVRVAREGVVRESWSRFPVCLFVAATQLAGRHTAAGRHTLHRSCNTLVFTVLRVWAGPISNTPNTANSSHPSNRRMLLNTSNMQGMQSCDDGGPGSEFRPAPPPRADARRGMWNETGPYKVSVSVCDLT
jgi:hypothetical protein